MGEKNTLFIQRYKNEVKFISLLMCSKNMKCCLPQLLLLSRVASCEHFSLPFTCVPSERRTQENATIIDNKMIIQL